MKAHRTGKFTGLPDCHIANWENVFVFPGPEGHPPQKSQTASAQYCSIMCSTALWLRASSAVLRVSMGVPVRLAWPGATVAWHTRGNIGRQSSQTRNPIPSYHRFPTPLSTERHPVPAPGIYSASQSPAQVPTSAMSVLGRKGLRGTLGKPQGTTEALSQNNHQAKSHTWSQYIANICSKGSPP